MAAAMVSIPELTAILVESQNPDVNIRRAAEQRLIQAEQMNFVAYIESLAKLLVTEGAQPVVRQLAGIILKNSISGTDPSIDKIKRDKWMVLAGPQANQIRESVLAALSSPVEEARSAACQVISKIGRLDLATNQWPTLMTKLMQLVLDKAEASSHRRAAVTAVGYICEDVYLLLPEVASEILDRDQINNILTTVTNAMTQTEDCGLTLAGCKAFYHALMFAEANLVNQNERSFIFSTIAQCLRHPDLQIQQSAWECVLQIAAEFYPHMDEYAADLGQHSIATIQEAAQKLDQRNVSEASKRQTEAVALAAVEFWNTICDVEISIHVQGEEEGMPGCKNYISRAKGVLLPVLFESMTKQSEEQGSSQSLDTDEWTMAMAAATCVGLCAQVLRDEILDIALQFITANFSSDDWKRREAAVFAYGSIMEGPSSEKLEPLLQSSFQNLCNALTDHSVAVRDTTAWTVGRIASFHPGCVTGLLGTPDKGGLMNVLLDKLNDEPRVAANVCFTLHELAANINKEMLKTETTSLQNEGDPNVAGAAAAVPGVMRISEGGAPTPLDPFFPSIASTLLRITQKPNAAESNLRQSAFEALGVVINAVGPSDECFNTMIDVLNTLCLWLDGSFSTQLSDEMIQIQGDICGCLTILINRLGSRIESLGFAEKLFVLFFKVVDIGLTSAPTGSTGSPVNGVTVDLNEIPGGGSKSGSEDEAVIAMGSLVRVAPRSLCKHITELTQVLKEGLRRPTNIGFCSSCIGVISEVACHMNLRSPDVKPKIQVVIPDLYNMLHDSHAPISLKPKLITAVGDLAIGMEADFEPMLEPFLQLLGQAISTKIQDGPQNEEWIEYFQELRDATLEAFGGILNGLRSCNKLHLLQPYVTYWLECIKVVVDDPNSSTSNYAKATEVTGELVMSYKAEIVSILLQLPFYKRMLEKGLNSEDDGLRRSTIFLRNAVVRCSK